MAFSDLVVSLRLNIDRFTNAMNSARQQTQRFSSYMASISRNGSADELIRGYTTLNDRLHKVGLGARDVARIVAGMTISQTFYGITRSIREATDALWSFNEGLDYAQVTYGALFGNSNLASNFIDTLKQFSIDTIFEYSDIEGMARKLSAYGIEYQNLMYIIEGLTNIGTISGDTAALERLAVAIGQINAKGTLKAEEMRQLANAYTPIYDILREKLGLSEEDLGMVGDLGISSADAINAIIDYANETFGATADAAVQTITGLNNRIVDSLKVMGADIMSPITTFYKSLASYIAGQLESIYNIYKTSGLGGVFEYLVPSDEWQQRIRSLIAAIKNSISTIASLVMTLGPYIKQFFGGMIDAFTIFLSVLNVVLSGMVGFLQTLSSNTQALSLLTSALVAAAGGWLLFKIQALGATVISVLKVIIVDVAKAVVFLTTVLTKHPLIAGLIIFGAVLLGVASNAKNTNSAISKLINSLNSFSIGGNTADDILQTSDAMKQGTTDADKFWNKMEDGAKDAEDAIGSAGKAAKNAGKNLLSFDEVFRLNDEASGAGTGAGANIGGLSGLGDLTDAFSGLGSALVPDIPDLSSFANDFVSSLYDSLWSSIKTIASGGAAGALIGGLVGFAIGGFVTKTMAGALTGAKWGARIGGIAGAAFAGFWTDSYKELEASLMKIATGGATGALAGGLVGMIIGAFATKTVDGALAGAQNGARLGGMLGLGLGSFWAVATEEMSNAIEGIIVGSGVGALTGALAGFIIGAFSTRTLKGALAAAGLGAKIGTAVGGVLGGIFGSFESELQAKIAAIAWGGGEGMLLGGIAGMILGAFATKTMQGAMAGAKLGSAIGGALGASFTVIFGEAESTLSGKLSNLFSSVSAASTGAFIGGIAGMIIGAIVGVFAGGVGAIPGAKIGATIGAALGALGGMLVQYLSNAGILEAIGNWFSNLWDSIAGWFVDVGTAIGNFFVNLWNTISTWFVNAISAIGNFFVNLWDAISTWFVNAISAIGNFFVNLWNTLVKWFKNAITAIGNFFVNLWNTISTWFVNAISAIGNFFVNLWNTISTWFKNAVSFIGNFFVNLWNTISTWFSNAVSFIGNFFVNLWNTISSWFKKVATGVGDSIIYIWKSISTWFSNVFSKIGEWFSNTGNNIKTWWNNMFDPSKWKSAWESVKKWFSDLWSSISSWFTDIGKSISNWWDGLWGDKSASVDVSSSSSGGSVKLSGHAKGGIFNREHIARFAEGNKAEAIIPLEDNAAMQPFVTAISEGILQGLLPAMSASGGSSNNLPPMYVGTLIGDERGLQQLFKKFELYEAKELARKGLL